MAQTILENLIVRTLNTSVSRQLGQTSNNPPTGSEEAEGEKSNGDEPLIDAQGISMQWGKTWPKVIARVWYIENKIEEWKKNYDLKKLKLENGKINIDDKSIKQNYEKLQNFYDSLPSEITWDKLETNQDQVDCYKSIEWYNKLFSEDKTNVQEALQEEGFAPRVKNKTMTKQGEKSEIEFSDDHAWFWKNINIIVKRSYQGVSLTSVKQEEKNIQRIEKIILPVFDKYENKDKHKPKVFSDLQNQNSVVVPSNTSRSSSTHQETLDKTQYEYKLLLPKDGVRINRQNGWINDHRLSPVVILTIPPKPKNPAHWAMALADYEAGGRVYPFTVCPPPESH